MHNATLHFDAHLEGGELFVDDVEVPLTPAQRLLLPAGLDLEGDAELEVSYIHLGYPDMRNGHPDNWYPGEGPELDVTALEVVVFEGDRLRIEINVAPSDIPDAFHQAAVDRLKRDDDEGYDGPDEYDGPYDEGPHSIHDLIDGRW